MRAEKPSDRDWRDPAAYAPLIEADPSLFAWEWLRRDPEYRSAVAGKGQSPEHFGLVCFEPPELGVPDARPLWRSEIHPLVLPTGPATAARALDEFDLDRLGAIARLVASDDVEHLLLSDGLRAIRLDGPRGAFSSGPVCLHYRIEGLASAERPLLSLRRFLALCRTGRFSRSLHGREIRARRWILMLRAHDALVAGADQREIAGELFSRSVSEARWRSRESSVRSRVQRLVRLARQFADGGFRALLC